MVMFCDQEVGFGRSVSLLVVDQPAAATELAAGQAAGGKVGESKWKIDPNEELRSTWEHRAWTFGCMALLAGGMGVALSKVSAGLVGATGGKGEIAGGGGGWDGWGRAVAR